MTETEGVARFSRKAPSARHLSKGEMSKGLNPRRKVVCYNMYNVSNMLPINTVNKLYC